ncbi:MAG: type II toxin-antitoxin system prevent-host-death family antitoxin [Dehalococcoidia bacterium]|nr:type II toxin-antitoxin system prevent-host-death family antitoxin [Dehalococcoidia bacterium]
MTTSEQAVAARGEREVAVEDAAARFAELLAAVEGGERVTITRDGRAVARLVPSREPARTPAEAAEELLEMRAEHRMSREEILEVVQEGRR